MSAPGTNIRMANVRPAVGAPAPVGATATGAQAMNSAKGKVTEAMSKGKEMIKNAWASKGAVMIFVLAVVLVFVIVIIYITVALKNSNLTGKVLTTKPIKLSDLSVPFEVSSSDIPKPAVGREYAYSFWIYTEAFEQSTNGKLIFYRGTNNDMSTANPIVFMDKAENRMYICIKTQDNTLPLTSPVDMTKIVSQNFFKNPTAKGNEVNKYIIMEVDYVPLQRWVNFIVIVDNKILTLFMDGEIYSVKSTDELKAQRKPDLDANGNPIPYSLIVDKTDNDIQIGKNSINGKVTLNGYLSKLEFHNYAISINQVKSIYNAGPLSKGGLLGNMGIQWGVRSPVYKLNESVE
jgi:hypothetical protein